MLCRASYVSRTEEILFIEPVHQCQEKGCHGPAQGIACHDDIICRYCCKDRIDPDNTSAANRDEHEYCRRQGIAQPPERA